MDATCLNNSHKYEFSVIVTCYLEEDSIEEFHQRLSRTISATDRTYEIIYVDDGSTDKTQGKLRTIFEDDKNVTVLVDLFRNVGQGAAITAGVTHACGDNFIFIDSDLQLDPEDLSQLMAKFDEDFDIVTGYRERRIDTFFRTIPSRFAGQVMRGITKTRLRDFGCNMKIVRGGLVRAFNFGAFKPWCLPAVIAQAQRVVEMPVHHHPRRYGKSGWTYVKLWEYNMDNVIRLSSKPFQFLSVLCLLLACLLAIRLGLSFFVPFSILSETTPGLILNFVIFSFLVLLSSLCAVGEFTIRTFVIVQKDPAYVVRNLYTKKTHESSPR